jgi:hypothetical protein
MFQTQGPPGGYKMAHWLEARDSRVSGSEQDVNPVTFEGLRIVHTIPFVLRGVSIDKPPVTSLRLPL